MDYKVLNIKQDSPTVELALANLEIEIEICKKGGVKLLKVIHGYGSHGTGGAICSAVRKRAKKLKRQGKICDFVLGSEWDLGNSKCINVLKYVKDHCDDEDLNSQNPGITYFLIQI